MRTYVGVTLLLVLGACGGEASAPPGPTAAEAFQQTCAQVRAGIDEFNRHDYAGTVASFERAKVPAKIYAQVSPEPEADALLDAVEYYANLAPVDYPEAARTSEHFARSKSITLNQCTTGEPIDETPPTPT
ncbi:MAG: hypothetical protein JWR27_840 [Aeromicrobium sp.]|jgi:hypothetical protein|nr:hypothetical protein [Aeromicrobium sp.]